MIHFEDSERQSKRRAEIDLLKAKRDRIQQEAWSEGVTFRELQANDPKLAALRDYAAGDPTARIASGQRGRIGVRVVPIHRDVRVVVGVRMDDERAAIRVEKGFDSDAIRCEPSFPASIAIHEQHGHVARMARVALPGWIEVASGRCEGRRAHTDRMNVESVETDWKIVDHRSNEHPVVLPDQLYRAHGDSVYVSKDCSRTQGTSRGHDRDR